jgi:DMSO/TMAO reductase YedYZ molybdopterin-dependent catalytic subunit
MSRRNDRNDPFRSELARVSRRLMLKRGLTLGGLTLLTGCDLSGNLTGNDIVDQALRAMLRLNYRVQALLFDPNRLADTYPISAVTKPFKFNAYYPEWQVRDPDDDWKLAVSGMVSDKHGWSVDELRAMPQESQVTRHVCIEGWSQIGQWSGVPLHHFLDKIGADPTARYVGFKCFDDYSTVLDMPTARHPQTILALDFLGQPLASQWGAPVRLRTPVKLGFKSAKNLSEVFVTNTYPGGYWENQGYDAYSGS